MIFNTVFGFHSPKKQLNVKPSGRVDIILISYQIKSNLVIIDDGICSNVSFFNEFYAGFSNAQPSLSKLEYPIAIPYCINQFKKNKKSKIDGFERVNPKSLNICVFSSPASVGSSDN